MDTVEIVWVQVAFDLTYMDVLCLWVCVHKPKIDERYSVSKVVTHSGQSMDGISINFLDDFEKANINLLEYDVLAVDEAFMIPGIPTYLKMPGIIITFRRY